MEKAARHFAFFLCYTTQVPDGTAHINENNEAPKYAYNRGIMPMEAEAKDFSLKTFEQFASTKTNF